MHPLCLKLKSKETRAQESAVQEDVADKPDKTEEINVVHDVVVAQNVFVLNLIRRLLVSVALPAWLLVVAASLFQSQW
jgi:hypothetical protein